MELQIDAANNLYGDKDFLHYYYSEKKSVYLFYKKSKAHRESYYRKLINSKVFTVNKDKIRPAPKPLVFVTVAKLIEMIDEILTKANYLPLGID